mgnify:CR=1 FL=1
MKSGIITPMLLIAFVFQMISAQAFAPAKKDMVVSGIPPEKVWSIVRYALDEEGIAVGKFDEKNNMLWSRPFDYKFLASDYRAKFVFTYQDGDLIVDMDDFYYKNNGRWETAELNASFVKANKLKKNMGKRIEELFTQPELMDKVMAKYPEKKEEPIDFIEEGKTAAMFFKVTTAENTYMILQSDGAIISFKMDENGTDPIWIAYKKGMDAEAFVLGVGDDGHPEWGVAGDYMAFYRQVDEEATNIALVKPDNSYDIEAVEPLNANYQEGSIIKFESAEHGPALDFIAAMKVPGWIDDLKRGWNISGRMLDYAGCGFAFIASGPVGAILPCGSLVIGEILEFNRDNLDPKAVKFLENLKTGFDAAGFLNFKNITKLRHLKNFKKLFGKDFKFGDYIDLDVIKDDAQGAELAEQVADVMGKMFSGITKSVETSVDRIKSFKESHPWKKIDAELSVKPIAQTTPVKEEQGKKPDPGPTEEEINARIEENTGDPESNLCEVLDDPSLGAWEFAREYIKAFYDSDKIDCFMKSFYQYDKASEEEIEFAKLFLREMQADVEDRLDGLRGIYKMEILEDQGNEVEYDIWVIYNNGKKDSFEVTVIKVNNLWRGKGINLDLF